VIIETGTAHGGSALFFATMLEKVNPSGRVITIEIDPDVDNNVSEAQRFRVFSDNVRIIKGDSVSSQTLSQVQDVIEEIRTAKNSRERSSGQQDLAVLVTLDSLHSAEHVLEELRLYSRFVSTGSYIVVQDTIIDRNPKYIDWFVRPWTNGAAAGPAQAVRKFLEENPDFRSDRSWEKFYFTFYPGGFLKRKN
jgi:cephalosporin hydroxylase